MSPAAKTYYPYLDKLRVFLTCLVIFHHTAIAFGASGGWYYKSPDLWSGWSERLMSLVMGIDQSYFMALFFLYFRLVDARIVRAERSDGICQGPAGAAGCSSAGFLSWC